MQLITKDDIVTHVFSGGEVHVELKQSLVDQINMTEQTSAIIDIPIKSSNDLMTVLILNDILIRMGIEHRELKLNYIPYARQDRVTIDYGPFSLKVFAQLVNSCKFNLVWVLDPHSPVATALIDNVWIRSLASECSSYILKTVNHSRTKPIILVAPDIGAIKRVEEVKDHLVKVNKYDPTAITVAYGMKHRNPATGAIESIEVLGLDKAYTDAPVFVVDDIADGGRTFTELVAQTDLKLFTNKHLWVTHGIFSRGTDCIFDAGYNTIGTTNSFFDETKPHPKVTCYIV